MGQDLNLEMDPDLNTKVDLDPTMKLKKIMLAAVSGFFILKSGFSESNPYTELKIVRKKWTFFFEKQNSFNTSKI